MKKIKLILIMALLAMLTNPAFANEYSKKDDTVKVVYQCDFANPKRVHLMLNTLNNAAKYYQKKMIDYKIDVVVLGPCLQYFMKDFKGTGFAKKPYLNHGGPTGKGTTSRFKSLKLLGDDNIELFACQNTMKKKNVKPAQILDDVELTPAGIIKIIDLQRKGDAYIKIR
jgi:intracellular sulfur oxidation DsrE/DsrF family protein